MVMDVTQVTGTNAQIAQALLTEILGDTTGLSNIQATITGQPDSFGKFTGDSFGLNGGIVLSTGVAEQVIGPNETEALGTELNGDSETNGGIFDEAVLTITFDASSATQAYFAYVFGSDEFIEFAGTEFNDRFELLINGVNAAKLSNGNDISVNSLVPDPNDAATWQPEFIDNTGGKASQNTELDGYTEFLTFAANLQAGANTIEIRVKDVGDNQYDSAVFIKKGSFSTTQPVVPTPPPVPTNLDLLTDTATTFDASTTDNRTYEATPDFSGTGFKQGNIIKLFSSFEGEIGQATVQADGTWTVTNASVSGADLLVGAHSIYAIEYDAVSGLASPASSSLNVYIDSIARETDVTAPVAPAGLDLVAGSDTVNSFGSQSNTDNDTDDRTPTITGTAEVNSVVTLYSDKDGVVGSVRVGRDGNWSITANLLQSGTHVLTAQATDQAGNASAVSAGLTVTLRNVPSVPNMTDASDTGISKTDNITFDTTPTFTGVAEAASMVEIFIDGVSVGTTSADAGGAWSYTATTLAEGTHTIKARGINRQTATYDDFSSELSFEIDVTTPLGAPSTPDLTAATDNGASNTDNITSVKSPSFTGTADPGSYVTVTSDLEGVLGKVKVDGTGKWTLNVSKRKKMRSGVHQITAVAEDTAGNLSPVSGALTMTSLPDVSAPDLLAADDSGISDSDNITKIQTPRFSGTAELGSLVTLFYFDGSVNQVIGSLTVTDSDAEGNGLWTITVSTLPEGVYDIQAKAEKSGFSSLVSAPLKVTIDTDAGSPTPAPTQPDMTAATDLGQFNTDNLTQDATPTFTGTVAAGNRVEVLIDGVSAGFATVVGTDWSFTPSANLSDGNHTIAAQAIDPAGNASVISTPLNFAIDTAILSTTPDMTSGTDSQGVSNTDNITYDTTPDFTGTVEADVIQVEILVDGMSQGLAALSGTTWSFTPGILMDGNHTIVARATDKAGNVSTDVPLNFTIDTVAQTPTKPDLKAASDSGFSNTDDLTNNAKPNFSGTLPEAVTSVEVWVDGISQGNATVSGTTWNFTPGTNLSEGNHTIEVKATDVAGNVSLLSPALSFEIDLTAPTDIPTPPDLTAATDSGDSNSDNKTNDTTPIFTGTFAGGNHVEILIDGISAGYAIVTGTNWSFTPGTAIGNGNHTIQARAVDEAGNPGTASSALNFAIDTAVITPTLPDLTAATDTGASSTDNITYDTTPDFVGTVDADVTQVEVFVDGVSQGNAVLSGSNWSFTPGAALADGNHTITVKATDDAGNVSALSPALNFVVDTISAPPQPDLTTATDSGQSNTDNLTRIAQPSFTGTTETGSLIEVFINGVSQGNAVVSGTTWNFTPAVALAEGNYDIKVKATDIAGNVSAFSPALNFAIDTTPPATPATIPDLLSDTGISTIDNLTKTTTPTFEGTVEAVDAVQAEIFVDGVSKGLVNLVAGKWNYTSSALTAGNHTIAAKAVDLAGNASSASALLNFTIDTTKPGVALTSSAPTLTNASPLPFTATFTEDVTGFDASDLTITNGTVSNFVVVNARTYTFDVTPTAQGAIAVNVAANKAQDIAGNDNTAATTINRTYDSVAPAIVNVTSTKANGSYKAGDVIDITLQFSEAITVSGVPQLTLETGSTDATAVYQNTSSNTLTFRYTVSAGENTLDLDYIATTALGLNGGSIKDSTGNNALLTLPTPGTANSLGANKNIVIDTIAPNAPIVTSISADTGSSTTDGTTSDHTLRINGTAEANTSVDVFRGGSKIGTASVDGAGNWSYDYTGTILPDGSYVFTAKALDLAGNTGLESATFNVTIDSAAPSKPVVTSISDDTGASSSDGLTNDRNLVFNGTAEVNSSVDVFLDGSKIATVNADGAGNWTVNYTGTTLNEAGYVLTAKATDLAGNTSVVSDPFNFTIDITVNDPSAPDMLDTDDSGESSTDNYTNVLQPQFQGTAEANSTIQLIDDLGNLIGTGTADAMGKWKITSTSNRKGVQKVKAIATDKAGNVSLASGETTFTIDDTAPNQPSVPDLSDASDTGGSNTDNITGNDQPEFTGTAEANSKVDLFSDQDGFIGTSIAGNDGKWVIQANKTLRKGAHKITTKSTDQAGNISPASGALDIQILTVDLSVDKTSMSENGGKAVITATLAAATSQDVVINLGISGMAIGSDYTLPTSITIKAGDTTGSVELVGVDDFWVEGSETVVVDILSIDNAVENGSQQVTVTLTDDDTAGINVSSTSLVTSENGTTASFNVVLTSQPTSDVVVTLSNGNPAEGTLDKTTLTFTAANWNIAQTVTVTGKNDDIQDGNATYTITTSATSSDTNYNGISIADVLVTNSDNDTAGITVNPGSLITSESGTSATFSVILNTQPTADVTVTLNNPSSEGTLDKTTLTFTAANWNVAQVVTVTGADDSLDDGDIGYTIATSATSSDTNYNSISVADIAVTNTDNDTAGITVTPSSTNVTEGGATNSYSIVLNSQPTGNVTVNINNGSQTTTNVTTLTFTPANWNVAQSVTLTAIDDSIAEGLHTGIVSHAVTSADPQYNGITIASVTANITDNDTAEIIITESAGSTNLAEGGATDTYSVTLNSQPTSDVVVTIGNGTQTNTNVTTLTFTSANWNVAQVVTVTAIDDLIAEGTHSGAIAHTVSSTDSQYNSISVASVNANITDNEVAGITVSPISLNTTEAGGTASFTVVLTSQPTNPVTINLVGNTAEGTLSTSTLIFDATNWNVAQNVTVTGVDDLVDDGDVSYTIQTQASSSDSVYAAIDPADVSVINANDDVAGVTVTPASGLFTNEAGGTATFDVVLTSRPIADVIVNLVSSQPGEGTVPTSITFTASNWNVAQTVTVTGMDDFGADGDQAYTIQTSITSSDVNYAAIDPSDVQVKNTDNDIAGINLTQSDGNTAVTEGAEPSDTYTLVLNSQPTGNVTITLATDGQTTAGQTAFVFTPANWNIAQIVTVTAVDDAVFEGNHTSSITHTVSSSDPNYNGVKVVPVNITVGDNDNAGVIVTPVDAVTGEDGSTGSFKVALTSQPTANVVLNFGSSNVGEGILQQNSITFSAANWNKAQTVTVKGVNDFLVDGNKPFSIAANISSSDSSYDGLGVAAIAFTNTDNDKAGVVIQPTNGLVTTEAGGTATFSVVLTSKPTANVVINLTSSNPQEGKVPSLVTFTPDQWNIPKTVTVTGVDDLLVDGDIQYTIQTRITSADTHYAAIAPGAIQVTNLDSEFNQAPTVTNVTQQIESAQSVNINGLSGSDADGSVVHYTIASLPDASQGVLYSGDPATVGSRIEAGQILKLEQISQIFFQSTSGFKGATFTYTTTDNLGKTGAPGTITLSTVDDLDAGDAGCSTRKGRVMKGKGLKDQLLGKQKRDRLFGGGGNDMLRGGGGKDTLNGGKGSDRLFGDACSDVIQGGFGNDRLRGGRGHDRLNGGRNNDRLFGNDHNDTLSGGSGRDLLKGGRDNDRLNGGRNNDKLLGNAGNDILRGGRGNDRLQGHQGEDKLSGGQGNDRLLGGGNNDTLKGGLNSDSMRGGSGNDVLKGGNGVDRLEGGAGNDKLDGGRSNDKLDGGRGKDNLKGGLNHDVLNGRQGGDSLNGGRGHDRLKGGSGSDFIKGDRDNDKLFGGGQADRLIGGSGNDQLTGGRGDDTLTGGIGRDRFIYTKFGEKLGDRITDFQVGQDLLDLGRLLSKVNAGSTATSPQVQLMQMGANTAVRVDLNGKASGGFQTLVTLENVTATTLTSKNFV
ncbi:MAG TPA: Ig-like domain-containing protein [Coleofasciculaceae cyanobacterium]|jgi:hypothetical protein